MVHSQLSPVVVCSSACCGCWRMQMRWCFRNGSLTCLSPSSIVCWTCSTSVSPASNTRCEKTSYASTALLDLLVTLYLYLLSLSYLQYLFLFIAKERKSAQLCSFTNQVKLINVCVFLSIHFIQKGPFFVHAGQKGIWTYEQFNL